MYGKLLSRYAARGGLGDWLRSRLPLFGSDPAVPRIVGVELTNACNLRCIYCDAQHPQVMRDRGFMDDRTLSTLLEQVRRMGVQTLRFIGAGEPTVHPRFVDFMARAKDAAPIVSVTTNGLLLNQTICTALTQFVDVVEISVDSDNPSVYERTRKGAKFSTLLGNVERLASATRARRSSTLVHVRVMVRPSDEPRAQEISEYWRSRSDVVTIQRIYDYYGLGGDMFPVAQGASTFRPCKSIFKMAGVNWNGDVPLCDSSALQLGCPAGLILGNVNQQALDDIWRCEIIRQVRQAHRERSYERAEVCRSCPGVW
jgi:radical SAM protein with 4Fe4S-binding SPASM domain